MGAHRLVETATVPKLLEAIYNLPAPATPRNDLVEIFLTGITTKADGPIKADLNSQLNNADVDASRFQPSEMLRLNLGVPVTDAPDRLGVLAKDLQGFPNGRRLTDDVLDIGLQALAGAAQTGQLVDALATLPVESWQLFQVTTPQRFVESIIQPSDLSTRTVATP